MTTQEPPISICRDEDCPRCGWPETYAEVYVSRHATEEGIPSG